MYTVLCCLFISYTDVLSITIEKGINVRPGDNDWYRYSSNLYNLTISLYTTDPYTICTLYLLSSAIFCRVSVGRVMSPKHLITPHSYDKDPVWGTTLNFFKVSYLDKIYVSLISEKKTSDSSGNSSIKQASGNGKKGQKGQQSHAAETGTGI